MGTNKDYVVISCISIVVACNAGGVISPFGDVTSLMVWQKEKLRFLTFFKLLVPGIVNWLVPAGIMVRLPSPRDLPARLRRPEGTELRRTLLANISRQHGVAIAVTEPFTEGW